MSPNLHSRGLLCRFTVLADDQPVFGPEGTSVISPLGLWQRALALCPGPLRLCARTPPPLGVLPAKAGAWSPYLQNYLGYQSSLCLHAREVRSGWKSSLSRSAPWKGGGYRRPCSPALSEQDSATTPPCRIRLGPLRAPCHRSAPAPTRAAQRGPQLCAARSAVWRHCSLPAAALPSVALTGLFIDSRINEKSCAHQLCAIFPVCVDVFRINS